jgi:hypothetical protein
MPMSVALHQRCLARCQVRVLRNIWLLPLLLYPYSAPSQVGSGTCIVVLAEVDYAVIAADSRASFDANRPPDDHQCKITAFSNRVIFAASGHPFYRNHGFIETTEPSRVIADPSWNAIEEARKSAQSKSGDSSVDAFMDVNNIADDWAKRMAQIWRSHYQRLLNDKLLTVRPMGKLALYCSILIAASGMPPDTSTTS